MGRVNRPAMVGNDIFVKASAAADTKKPTEARREVVFSPAPVDPSPYQNLGTLAFNSPASVRTPFALPSINSYGSRFFSKARIVPLIVALALIGITATVIADKQQIIRLASAVQSTASRVTKSITGHDSVASAANPRQLIIHSSDFDSAMTALMTQQITLNLGNTSQTVNGSTISNWLNIKKQGSLTFLSVNTNQLSGYVNQLVKTDGLSEAASISSNSAINQIANNLLKAKGMTVSLSTS